MTPKQVQAAVKAFGSQQRMANALGVNQSVVAYWVRKGAPRWRVADIKAARAELKESQK